tara:strand:+ start:2030 stop:2347 length:318 start_codon:yes stop_codon:yes gene_type:complete
MGLLGVSLTGVGITTVLRKVRAKNARILANDLFSGVKQLTPVDTGTAKRGWKMARRGKGYLITNNVPYITVLDKGRHMTSRGMRGSVQAPRGMTGPTLKRVSRKK